MFFRDSFGICFFFLFFVFLFYVIDLFVFEGPYPIRVHPKRLSLIQSLRPDARFSFRSVSEGADINSIERCRSKTQFTFRQGSKFVD